MDLPQLHEFLSHQKLGVLGTIGPSGAPQAALVGIAITPQFEIIFDTVRSSRKYPNLVARPECSFVIAGWSQGEKTVQYEGRAQELKSPERENYLEIYFKTWPDGPARQSWPGIVHFVVRPAWIRYSDFDQGPPLVREFTF
jgi:pyridoxine/pyridoxamine 5'-phosphate oxidase